MKKNPQSEPSKVQAPASTVNSVRFADSRLLNHHRSRRGRVLHRARNRRESRLGHSYLSSTLSSERPSAGSHACPEQRDEFSPGAVRSPLSQSDEQNDLARQTVDTLRTLTEDNPRQQERLSQLGQMLKENRSLLDDQRDSAGTRIQLSASEHKRQAEIADHGKQIAAIVSTMQDEEESLLDQRLNAWDYLFKRNVLMLALAFAVVTLMLAYNFRLLVARGRPHQRYRETIQGQCGVLSANERQDPRIAGFRAPAHRPRTA